MNGNNIPDSWLDEWQAKHGFAPPQQDDGQPDEMPQWLWKHLQEEFNL